MVRTMSTKSRVASPSCCCRSRVGGEASALLRRPRAVWSIAPSLPRRTSSPASRRANLFCFFLRPACGARPLQCRSRTCPLTTPGPGACAAPCCCCRRPACVARELPRRKRWRRPPRPPATGRNSCFRLPACRLACRPPKARRRQMRWRHQWPPATGRRSCSRLPACALARRHPRARTIVARPQGASTMSARSLRLARKSARGRSEAS
mmetsp:Transcript_107924/g.344511  ORF Transcript_107924/g.344511 Transcript_107924/m.344511 type:complete len:208 (-) Transcript_107924:262-885(-)